MISFFNYDPSSFSFTLNNEYILLIKEFNEVVKSTTVENAFEIFKYIFFIEDPRSPYNDLPLEEKEQVSLEAVNLDDDLDWTIIEEARQKYAEILDTNIIVKTVKDLEIGLHKLSSYCRLVDFNKVIEAGANKGKLLHSPTELLRITKELDKSIDTAKKLRKTLEEELKQQSEIRGDFEKGYID